MRYDATHLLLNVIGLILLACATIAAGMYAWHGHWLPVGLALAAAFVGKMLFGFVEIMLFPLSYPMLHFARRGHKAASCVIAVVFSTILRCVFAAYCGFLLLYFFYTPGPPAWLAVTLAVLVTSGPFHWAAEREPDEEMPRNLDFPAAFLGVAISGALLVLGMNPVLALLPLALFFLVSAGTFVLWWMTRGAQHARIQHAISGGI